MAEKKPFILYEYLMFFWRKKVVFIIIPLIFALLGFGASYLYPNNGKYVGNATVFTGAIDLKAMTNPSHVVAQFGEDVDGEIDAYVSSESYIKIKVFSDDKEELAKDLNNMVEGIEAKLLESYDLRLSFTEKRLETLEQREVELKEAIEIYLDELENGNLTIEESQEYTKLLSTSEVELTDAQTKAQSVRNDIAFFEKPAIVKNEVTLAQKYTTEFVAAGIILGIFAAVLLLMFWKYILDARNYFKQG